MVLASGKPIAVMAREIGVHEGTLTNWVNKYRREHPDEEPSLTLSDRVSFTRVRKRNP